MRPVRSSLRRTRANRECCIAKQAGSRPIKRPLASVLSPRSKYGTGREPFSACLWPWFVLRI